MSFLKKITRGSDRLLDRLDDQRLQLLDARVRDLDDDEVVIAIDDESRQLIALGVARGAARWCHRRTISRRAIERAIRSRMTSASSTSSPNVSARRRICECGEWNPDASTLAALVDEIGDRRIVGSALAVRSRRRRSTDDDLQQRVRGRA